MQWLGDVSYSVYLWHWPLIVLAPFAIGHSVGLPGKAVIVVVTLVLAALTKRYVEDPFRSRAWNRRLGRTYLLGAVGMVLVIGLAQLQIGVVDRREDAARDRLASIEAGNDPCLGAGALDADRDCPPWTGDPVPTPALAAQDKSEAYAVVSGGTDCWAYLPRFPTVACDFGDPDGTVDVALVGNSHAGQWLPALQQVAKKRGWHITTHLASRCAMSDLRQQFDTAAMSTACRDWVRRTTDTVIDEQPDLVVLTNRVSAPAEGSDRASSADAYRQGYQRVLRRWSEAGLPVLAVHDTPSPVNGGDGAVPDCVAVNPDDLDSCAGDPAQWITPDPVMDAVDRLDRPRVSATDLNDHICTAEECAAVVGGVIVYFDASHLTATYAQTMSPYLAAAMDDALRR